MKFNLTKHFLKDFTHFMSWMFFWMISMTRIFLFRLCLWSISHNSLKYLNVVTCHCIAPIEIFTGARWLSLGHHSLTLSTFFSSGLHVLCETLLIWKVLSHAASFCLLTYFYLLLRTSSVNIPTSMKALFPPCVKIWTLSMNLKPGWYKLCISSENSKILRWKYIINTLQSVGFFRGVY